MHSWMVLGDKKSESEQTSTNIVFQLLKNKVIPKLLLLSNQLTRHMHKINSFDNRLNFL